MFETSVVRSRALTRGSHYRFLSLSLAVHSGAIAAVILATVASTRLPTESPRQMEIPFLIPVMRIPPALGTPGVKPAQIQAATPPAVKKPAMPVENAAPQIIPDQTAVATQPEPSAVRNAGGEPVETPGTGTGKAGKPDGVDKGIGQDRTGPIGDATPMRVAGEVKAPVVISRVLPEYPRVAMMARMNGWVIVECIIDTTGHIREARVVKSSFGAFEQPALDAVEKWVFTPGTLRGQPVNTIFDLTVTFQMR